MPNSVLTPEWIDEQLALEAKASGPWSFRTNGEGGGFDGVRWQQTRDGLAMHVNDAVFIVSARANYRRVLKELREREQERDRLHEALEQIVRSEKCPYGQNCGCAICIARNALEGKFIQVSQIQEIKCLEAECARWKDRAEAAETLLALESQDIDVAMAAKEKE